MVAAQVCQSQLVGRSEDSLIGVPVHSSRVGVVPVSSEGPSSILDVSAGAVVSISSATSMVGQGSKVNRDSVSQLVSFAQPIVSSVVSVDELDDRVGIVSPSVERVERVVLRNGFGSSCSPILDVDSDVQFHLLKRTTHTSITLCGHARRLFMIPTCFRPITDLDLSILSPWAYPLLSSSSYSSTSDLLLTSCVRPSLSSVPSLSTPGHRALLRFCYLSGRD
ncbi:hypothetical protein LWI29_019804 [Acer saccharum]|uniref:Uncharacterized protein n=1 Tax=Acer saccharum TaxID=4024 RepID=A0AA39SLG0_ACESA|nr:hypothetical protein LWI29_019804 [Acer saccharum]